MDELDAELARAGGVLLEDRVVRRVIKQHRRLPGLGLQVPHARCYALPRAELERMVDRDELAADPAELPDDIAIFGGSRTALAAGDPAALSQAWRAIFHARVHQALDARVATGAITAASIRAQIHRIGQTEFDEIRAVLRQEELLLPPGNDTAAYIEFVALYLELRAFAPRALDRTFPTLDLARVDATVALDLDGAALLAAARPARAPEQPIIDESTARAAPAPGAPGAPGRDDGELPAAAAAVTPAVRDRSARKRAGRARYKGNRARAAILALRAGDRDAALDDLDELCARLARAVGSAAPGPDWAAALLPVAEAAAAQPVLRRTPGVRLLHDLQTACVVAEREVQAVDVAGWLWSRRKRPLVRPLPATREVRVAKHLHAAVAKIAEHPLASRRDQRRLAAVVRDIVERADHHVRVVLRPKLEAALDGVALHPRNLPERVAQKKLIDELLDRAVAVGQLSIGNLRDAISHNDLKLPDLSRARLRSGDELLRCDDALSRSLDGVYRRGEGYLRFLQKISSILFGTRLGRLLTLYAILPLLGSYLVFEGVQHMVGWVAKHTIAREPVIATTPRIYAGAALLFLLIHVPIVRRGVVIALRLVGRGLRLVLIDLPRAVLRRPLVRRLLDSQFARWVLQPAVPAAITYLATERVEDLWRWPIVAAVFAAFAFGLNSRLGRRAQEIAADAVVRWAHHLTGRVVPGAIKWLIELFAELIEHLDRGLYRVDEWLRFKSGQSVVTLVAKGAFGLVWSVVAYVLRIYINLFIEPEVNPIKHFPVVTVVAKILLPFSEPMVAAISSPVTQLVGPTLGVSFGAFTVLVLPGLAGFLVWEFKENWRLYRNSRPATLHEVAIGHHGETMVGFLKPGFHSGTIPKRFTKLRRAAWKADERAVAKHRAELHHVEAAIRTFVDRELVTMLNAATAFRVTDVASHHVALGSNRVHIDLACPSVAPDILRIAFEQQAGWMVASIPERGWLDGLTDDQRQIFEIALAGFYKRSGVDLVREQLEHALGGDGEPPPYDISEDGLIVWPGHGYQTEAVYNLRSPRLLPTLRGASWSGELPVLAGQHALYCREPLRWAAWTQTWEQLARGEPPLPVVAGPSLLRRPPPPAAQLAG